MGTYEGDDSRMVDAAVAKEHAEAAAGLSFDWDNVLYVRKAILDECEELNASLVAVTTEISTMAHRYGDDPVSGDASVAFPERVAELFKQCGSRVTELNTIAESLADAARAYGFTEEQLASAAPVNTKAAVASANATLHSMFNPWERT
jgi:hypothetical protein